MYTSINEFFFSKHYAYDNDNRFNQRIRNAEIENKLKDVLKAKNRFKKVLYHYTLSVLDKGATMVDPIVICIGNIFFRENSKIQKAELNVEGRIGSLYVILIKEQTVVTVTLHNATTTNQEIKDKIYNHDKTEIKKIFDAELNELSFKDSKRKPIIIDLDISDEEFNKEYPPIILKNNNLNKILTGAEKLANDSDLKTFKPTEKIVLSPTIIPSELKTLIPDKEYVIYEGMEILVSYPTGIKSKKIRELVIDEKSDNRKFSIVFENTLKPLELNVGTQFIISPKIKNEEYRKLIDAFKLEDGTEFNFSGPIVKFNYYKKGKGGSLIPKLGIIIEPRTIL